jgi:putative effector of murein hydrolase
MAVLKVNIWWKKYMTMFQIIQFLLDVAAAGSNVIWNFYFATPSCSSWEIPWANPIAIGIVLSYLFLFIEFFFKTYTTKPAAAGKGKPKDE